MTLYAQLPAIPLVIALLAVISLAAVPTASAQLSVSTDQHTYEYGDRLTITIVVQDIIEDFAFVYIQDADGIESSPIPVSISSHQTILPSPFPFDRITYPDGMYRISVLYGGFESSTEFELIETGTIVVPIWIRQVASHWLAGDISTEHYADTLMRLPEYGILEIPARTDTIHIPAWIKDPTAWWLQDVISDTTYVLMLQYIIDNDIR